MSSVDFRDRHRSPQERAGAILEQLTLDEKLAMLHQHMPAVPRLGIHAFKTGSEILHGLAWLGVATVFPQAVGLGASWNDDLLRAVGSAVGDEVRDRHRNGSTAGLNVWGPVVNLLRDPRWGRNEEGYSEDPQLAGALAAAYCRGLCGDGADGTSVLKTAPTLKHFLAYNHESDRAASSSELRPRVLWEYEIRAFEHCIRAGVVTGVMAASHMVNGRPCCLGPHFDVLRAWQRDLVVVSDAHAPIGVVEDAHYYDDRPSAYAAALRAGLDSFTCDSEDPVPTLVALRSAIESGLIGEREVDGAVGRLLLMRVRLGEFDAPDEDPSHDLDGRTVDAPAHRALARTAARQSIVLLKNDPPVLPLPAGIGRVGVIGPLADALYLDWYSGELPYRITPLAALRDRLGDVVVDYTEAVDRISLRLLPDGGHLTGGAGPAGAGVHARAAEVGPRQLFDVLDWGAGVVSLRCVNNGMLLSEHEDGLLVNDAAEPHGWLVRETLALEPAGDALLVRAVTSGRYLATHGSDGSLRLSVTDPAAAARFERHLITGAADAARTCAERADVVIAIVGTHPLVNGCETSDRMDLDLPLAQADLVRVAASANSRIVVALVTSHPVTAPWLDAHASSILWSCHGGQEMAGALADVVTGDHAPSGRLPQTWYRGTDQLGDIHDYDIVKCRKTYLYHEGPVWFPFGHGLGYASFRYGPLRLSQSAAGSGDQVLVDVDVYNRSSVDGDEVVQLYVRAPGREVPRPLRELVGFRRLRLPAGTSATASFALPVARLSYWDVQSGRFRVEPGAHLLMVGSSSADVRSTATLTVSAAPRPARSLGPGLVRAADFDDCAGIRLIDETRVCGDAVEAVARPAWLSFRDVALDATTLVARAARSKAVRGALEIRLDDPLAGPMLVRVELPEQIEPGAWSTLEAPIRTVRGQHDIYIVLEGAARLASFALTAG